MGIEAQQLSPGWIFASGITPLIALYLFQVDNTQPWLICAYVVFAVLVSMVSAILIGRQQQAT